MHPSQFPVEKFLGLLGLGLTAENAITVLRIFNLWQDSPGTKPHEPHNMSAGSQPSTPPRPR
jgi:hypothetical protein